MIRVKPVTTRTADPTRNPTRVYFIMSIRHALVVSADLVP
jgi:hypothetical protein